MEGSQYRIETYMFAHYLNGKLEQVTSNILTITSLEKFANVKLNAQ